MAHSASGECSLAPGLANFVPASEFGLDNIPNGFRSPTMLQYIKNVSARTVKVVRTCPASDKSRPSAYDLDDDKRYGSGLVVKVEHLDWTCECLECIKSSQPESHSWAVLINTAFLLVADSQEAKQTQVELFYDDQSSRDEGRVITLQGADVEDANPISHVSLLVCFTHDAALATRLDVYRKESMDLQSALLREIRDDAEVTQYVVICHPLGQPKTIWVGWMLDRVGGSGYMYTKLRVYSARMCPGVQGGPVIVLHGKDSEDRVWIPVVDRSIDSFQLASNDLNPSMFC